MTDRPDADPPLPLPPEFHRQLHLADAGITVALALAAAGLAWMVTHPPGPMPPPELSSQPPLYWVPVPPIQDARTLAVTMAAAAGAVLACHLDPAYPLVRWVSRKFRLRPDPAGDHHWLRGILAPALRQSTMRTTAFVAGVVGIVLWNFGLDGMEGLRASGPAVWTLGIVSCGLMLALNARWAARTALPIASTILAFQAGIGVAGWALAAALGTP